MIVQRLVEWALTILLKKFVVNIQHDTLKNIVFKQVKKIAQIALIFFDKKPNAEQLKEIWESEKLNILDDGLDAAILIIENKLPDGLNKSMILELLRAAEGEIIGSDELQNRGIMATFTTRKVNLLDTDKMQNNDCFNLSEIANA